ncbi:MAG: twin-arginine translocase subunit TatC [Gloeomargarita sp. SKYBB_i_bin120]|nr:twin-arginine translocase subunit TatC [Gloeomargarita sp. SKYB120]MDW8178656.1 twin-arginine translocase subunit TatC [Gloeomargarita sp. SKYBB_i_bin120]
MSAEPPTPVLDPLDETPDDVEMPLFDHLEELRQRIWRAIAAFAVATVICFIGVKPIVRFLEAPAGNVKFLQMAPGEFFFVSLKVAAYSGLILSSPMILYQIIAFVLPGLTRRERRLLGPVVLGSSVLFVLGMAFAYGVLIPAALRFFLNYGADAVEPLWSIERYFEFVLILLLGTGLAFQIPVVQFVLSALGLVSPRQMLAGWRYVVLVAVVVAAILTPSTDPLTQILLAGAMAGLYLSGIGLAVWFLPKR